MRTHNHLTGALFLSLSHLVALEDAVEEALELPVSCSLPHISSQSGPKE